MQPNSCSCISVFKLAFLDAIGLEQHGVAALAPIPVDYLRVTVMEMMDVPEISFVDIRTAMI